MKVIIISALALSSFIAGFLVANMAGKKNAIGENTNDLCPEDEEENKENTNDNSYLFKED